MPTACRPARGLAGGAANQDDGVVAPPELPGAGSAGEGAGAGAGAGAEGAGAVVAGAPSPAGAAASSFLLQAVRATAITEARIKVLLIMVDTPVDDDFVAPLGETSSQATGIIQRLAFGN
ncbi:hypothetical protein BBB43_11405 [Bordetella parapertussis]|nr:hypothetical protein BBB43_11405 [Bordetella parapertussis]MCE7077469.1 hypothetical protein [Bordetella bronchiseptica]